MKRLKQLVLLGAVLGCISLSTMGAFAATICRHPSIRTEGQTISRWTTTHQVQTHVDQYGTHTETCYISNSVERITHTCNNCGYVVGYEDFFNIYHSFCG